MKREGAADGQAGGEGGTAGGEEGRAGVGGECYVPLSVKLESQFTHKFYEIDASDKAPRDTPSRFILRAEACTAGGDSDASVLSLPRQNTRVFLLIGNSQVDLENSVKIRAKTSQGRTPLVFRNVRCR